MTSSGCGDELEVSFARSLLERRNLKIAPPPSTAQCWIHGETTETNVSPPRQLFRRGAPRNRGIALIVSPQCLEYFAAVKSWIQG